MGATETTEMMNSNRNNHAVHYLLFSDLPAECVHEKPEESLKTSYLKYCQKKKIFMAIDQIRCEILQVPGLA